VNTTETIPARVPVTRSRRIRFDPRDLTVYGILVLVFGVFALTIGDQGFLNSFNLKNIVITAGPIAIMGVAAVFVLSSGEIDLSIGSVVALSSLVCAVVMRDHGPALGIAAGLGTGVGVGAVNGFLVTKAKMPSFLVTLASLVAVEGLARRITDLQSVAVSNNWFIAAFGGGDFFGVSTMILWAAGVALVAGFFYRRRQFGAHVRATGDNREAAITAGINVDRVRMKAFVMSGAAASLAGLLYSGRIETARYTLGENDLLTVIAAVIIGGTSLFGGRGVIGGAVAGALLLAMLNNGLILFGLTTYDQSIALGILIVLAVLLGRKQYE
jgi:ribose transport system permease protein